MGKRILSKENWEQLLQQSRSLEKVCGKMNIWKLYALTLLESLILRMYVETVESKSTFYEEETLSRTWLTVSGHSTADVLSGWVNVNAWKAVVWNTLGSARLYKELYKYRPFTLPFIFYVTETNSQWE